MDSLLHVFDLTTIASAFDQFRNDVDDPAFWLAVGKIIWIDIVLSGDNALVIALACRGLPPQLRFWGVMLGAGAAVGLRIIFAGIITTLMGLPYLKLAGGLALLVIATKLLLPERQSEEEIPAAGRLWAAVRVVVVADFVMSLDNVIAIAAAAKGSVPLLIIGLAVSVPLIVTGAALIMMLLTRLPFLIWAGSALLGWVAGEVIATDPAVAPQLHQFFDTGAGTFLDAVLGWLGIVPQFASGGPGGEVLCGVLGVMIVLIAGSIWRNHMRAADTSF
ncbi:TerC family protein [Nitrobacter sp. TKz-YC02]|uniref:TerC family protein n=1 Tax=Nitrobacter sp. TKz-YC02 TaxID=3398704 RepID=UPI003CF3413B